MCLDDDLRKTFHAMVCADALLVARSSLSYAAALLSRGEVYADCIQHWWHAPLPAWKRLAEVEAQAIVDHRKQRDEAWLRAWS